MRHPTYREECKDCISENVLCPMRFGKPAVGSHSSAKKWLDGKNPTYRQVGKAWCNYRKGWW